LAFFKTRLRRARLAGALVALGMVFGSELLRNSSFSELLFHLSIPATSLADAAPQRRTRCADRHDAETSSGQDKERLENDNCFLGNFRGTKKMTNAK
jgi:hypothetical protein